MKTGFSIVIATSMIGLVAYAQNCDICGKTNRIFAEMAKVKPEPTNDTTINQQEAIINASDDLVKTELTNPQSNRASMHALVKLILKTVPYDNSFEYVLRNQAAFKAKYNEPNSVLKAAIDEMVASGELSVAARDKLLAEFGVKPYRNSANDSKTEKKSLNRFADCPQSIHHGSAAKSSAATFSSIVKSLTHQVDEDREHVAQNVNAPKTARSIGGAPLIDNSGRTPASSSTRSPASTAPAFDRSGGPQSQESEGVAQ